MNEILNPQILEDFHSDFINRLSSCKLSYYLREKGSNKSKENAIHASIIWIREAVRQINNSKTVRGSEELSDLFVFISFIDILLESSDQIYCTLYNKDFNTEQGGFCFHGVPSLYEGLDNKKYFKEIRALFSAHPVNLREPSQKPRKARYADLPFVGTNDRAVHDANLSLFGQKLFAMFAGLKGNFYTRIWTATKDDEDTIYFPLYINDLIAYASLIYERLPEYKSRLKQIANRKI